MISTESSTYTLHVSREGLGKIVAVCIVLPHRSAALAFRQVAYEGCLQAARLQPAT